jgi:hypothetical protein
VRAVLALLVLAMPALVMPPAHAAADDEDPDSLSSPWWRLADPKVSRKELLKELIPLRDAVMPPGSPGIGNASEETILLLDGVEMLERMVKEDEAHVAPDGPLEKLPAPQRVAELVFRLRDETGFTDVVSNGGPGLFTPASSGKGPTISDRLVTHGHAAVPVLLERLEDRRFTRVVSADWGRGGQGCIRIMRIGLAAKLIVERIAGRGFGWGPDGDVRARRWWSDVQEKGEFLAVADEMEQGGTFGPMLARRLVAIDAQAGAPFVVRAARAEENPLHRKAYLDILGGLPGPGVIPFLRRELRKGPTLLHRVSAAFALVSRDDDAATGAMLAEWKNLSDYGSTRRTGHKQWTIDGGIHQLVYYLVTHGGSTAIRALGTDLGKRPVRARGLVAQTLGRGVIEYKLTGYLGHMFYEAAPGPEPDDGRETLLLSMLADRARVDGMYAPWIWRGEGTDARTIPLRVADIAARSLAALYPKRYAFDLPTKIEDRDLQIERMRR